MTQCQALYFISEETAQFARVICQRWTGAQCARAIGNLTSWTANAYVPRCARREFITGKAVVGTDLLVGLSSWWAVVTALSRSRELADRTRLTPGSLVNWLVAAVAMLARILPILVVDSVVPRATNTECSCCIWLRMNIGAYKRQH